MSTTELYDPQHLDQYDYKLELRGLRGWIRRTLWFCAAADEKILERCPHSERVKFEGLGGVVLATAVLALISAWFAMYTVFGPREGMGVEQPLDWWVATKAAVVAIIWSLIIFNLDRFIVSATGHGNGTENISLQEFAQAIPRLIMAAFIGLTVSAPLEIRVMKTEIEAKLNEIQYEHIKQRTADAQSQFDTKKIHYEQKKNEVDQKVVQGDDELEKIRLEILKQRHDLDDEASGHAANKQAGEGPGYRSKEKNLNKMESEYEAKVAAFKTEKERLNADSAQAIKDIEALRTNLDIEKKGIEREAKNLDGLSRRISIAHEIAPWIAWSLMGLLICIEITPIFIKLMLIRGPYDFLVDNQNRIVLARYGIEVQTNIHANQNGSSTQEVKEIYHQADTIREHVVESFEVENALASIAREAFKKKVSADIEKNPDKYISDKTQAD